jgi:hypothetical protein
MVENSATFPVVELFQSVPLLELERVRAPKGLNINNTELHRNTLTGQRQVVACNLRAVSASDWVDVAQVNTHTFTSASPARFVTFRAVAIIAIAIFITMAVATDVAIVIAATAGVTCGRIVFTLAVLRLISGVSCNVEDVLWNCWEKSVCPFDNSRPVLKLTCDVDKRRDEERASTTCAARLCTPKQPIESNAHS